MRSATGRGRSGGSSTWMACGSCCISPFMPPPSHQVGQVHLLLTYRKHFAEKMPTSPFLRAREGEIQRSAMLMQKQVAAWLRVQLLMLAIVVDERKASRSGFTPRAQNLVVSCGVMRHLPCRTPSTMREVALVKGPQQFYRVATYLGA